jgi:hypothetical protein
MTYSSILLAQAERRSSLGLFRIALWSNPHVATQQNIVLRNPTCNLPRTQDRNTHSIGGKLDAQGLGQKGLGQRSLLSSIIPELRDSADWIASARWP